MQTKFVPPQTPEELRKAAEEVDREWAECLEQPWGIVQRVVSDTPSRNEKCPCGSGKKYKRCCGG